jgi:hypothetical protein
MIIGSNISIEWHDHHQQHSPSTLPSASAATSTSNGMIISSNTVATWAIN